MQNPLAVMLYTGILGHMKEAVKARRDEAIKNQWAYLIDWKSFLGHQGLVTSHIENFIAAKAVEVE